MGSVIFGQFSGAFYTSFVILLSSSYLIASSESRALEQGISQSYDMGRPANGINELEDQSMGNEKTFNEQSKRSNFANPFILKKDAKEANTAKSGLDYRYFKNPFIFKRENLQRQPFLRNNYQNPFIFRRDQDEEDNYASDEKMFHMPSILKRMIERENGILY